MCGICGTFGDVSPIVKKLLLTLNENRGTDSVGMAVLSGDEWKRTRSVNSPTKTVYKDIIDRQYWNKKVWLCHNRNASLAMARPAKNSCHPFLYKNILGAHNGFIGNWQEIIDKYKKQFPLIKSFEVDSQVIFFLLSEFGFKGLEEVAGKASVWWVDKGDTSTAYLWVWKKELCIARKPTLAFSSEKGPLKAAGFKDIINLDTDVGQLLAINTDDGSVERLEDIKGNTTWRDKWSSYWDQGWYTTAHEGLRAVTGKQNPVDDDEDDDEDAFKNLEKPEWLLPLRDEGLFDIDYETYKEIKSGRGFECCGGFCPPLKEHELIDDGFGNLCCPVCNGSTKWMTIDLANKYIHQYETNTPPY